MAQVLFIKRLERFQITPPPWRVESAGTWAQDGSPAARFSRETMAQRGLDLRQHKARTVNADLLGQFNLILTMEDNHKEALVAEFPGLAQRIFMLSEMSGRKLSINDPIGGELIDYQQCANEIEAWFESGWQKILKLA
jgi:protein-tyrosine phosphatase